MYIHSIRNPGKKFELWIDGDAGAILTEFTEKAQKLGKKIGLDPDYVQSMLQTGRFGVVNLPKRYQRFDD